MRREGTKPLERLEEEEEEEGGRVFQELGNAILHQSHDISTVNDLQSFNQLIGLIKPLIR